MLPEEFRTVLAGWVERSGVHVLAPRLPSEANPLHVEPLDIQHADEILSQRRIYLAARAPDAHEMEQRPDLARLGWIQSDVPKLEDNCLVLIQMGARSDWYDDRERVVKDNPESIQLFDRLRRQVREGLSSPVWVTNIRSGASRAYSDIGYTAGARRWYEQGHQWCQAGVANQRFSPEPLPVTSLTP